MVNEITAYAQDGSVLDELAQYDKNVVVCIKEQAITTNYPVHFFNKNSALALVVDSTYGGGTLKAKIPNILLTERFGITGYVYVTKDGESKSVYGFTIQLKERPQPSDFIYPGDDDYITATEVLAECRELAEQADSSKTAAAQSASSAESSKTAAAKSADDAAASSTAAEKSAEAAKGSETASKASADAAKDSETKAGASQKAAGESASSAAASAAAAGKSETNAGNSAKAAESSKTEAAGSATAASQSATDAAGSAKTATEQASAAGTAKTAAETAQKAAQASQTAAAASATTAGQHATAAQTAKTAAEAAAKAAEKSAEIAAGVKQTTMSLLPASWTGNGPYLYTIKIENLSATQLVFVHNNVNLSQAQIEAFADACITGQSQTAGQIVLQALKKPEMGLPIVIEVGGEPV